jgi:hypothetical protein
MLKRLINKIISSISGVLELTGLAITPYVFDRKTDSTLVRFGRDARNYLEQVPLKNRKKIVYFLGYYQSKFLALNDATMILALQLRGVDVIPVLSGFFYQKEDVIYGGHYNKNRFGSQYRYSYDENRLVSSILNTDPISLVAFANKQTEIHAKTLSDSANYSGWREQSYSGYAIGEMAEKLVSNMNNVPAMMDTPEHLEQFRWHLYNIVRLIDASSNLLSAIKPDAIVSNTPFYYKWGVPYQVAQSLKIPFYSYFLGERKNTFIWALNSTKLIDASASWKSFLESDIYEEYKAIVEQGIEDRMQGNVSHIPFVPRKNDSHSRISQLNKSINNRPAILFPVNVLTDASVLTPSQSFNSCLDMVADVIEYFRVNPAYVCLLKAHPAEKILKSSGTNIDSMHLRFALEKANIELPENVLFIDYDEDMSSFNLYQLASGLIAYSSSTCMEMSWFGKPIITAFDAHYTCAGFAYVPISREDFFQTLSQILRAGQGNVENSDIKRLGRIYYLLYYYICQIDTKLIEGNDIGTIRPRLLYEHIDELLPGKNSSLDYICDSILNGKPIYSEDRWPPISI